MKRLTHIQKDNSYSVNSRKQFSGLPIRLEEISKVANFSYKMCFGKGHHRNSRSGGSYKRRNGEKFCNTFQGKLAEVVCRNYLIQHHIDCDEIDFSVEGKGKWDDTDLVANHYRISVKSASYFSNLLLLETKDWNSKGEYLPNIDSDSSQNYDAFVLVRIQPDIKTLFRSQRLFYTDYIEPRTIKELLIKQKWEFDIAGFCYHKDLINIIKDDYILPKNSLLNGKTKMDASNFYLQTGDLRNIESLINFLNS